MTGTIVSLQVGLPTPMPTPDSADAPGKAWVSGFIKQPVFTSIRLGKENLEGDGQADRVHHGGAHKAVCVYSAEHYPEWQQSLSLPELTWGGFGENLTVAELTEADVCIGDIWTIGTATVQVSQPRQPCWKLARRWGIRNLAKRVQQTGRTGWYFRVLEEGQIQQGMPMTLSDRTWPQWSISASNHVMHHDKANLTAARHLAALPSLSPSWTSTLNNRIQQDTEPDEQKRLEDSGQ